MATLKERIVDCIENEVDDEDLVNLVNEINGYNGNFDSLTWYPFDEEFFENFFSDPMEAARATFFGDIHNWNDELIRFDSYGNLESSSYGSAALECIGYADEIADEIIENPDQYYLPTAIKDCFKEEDEEEEEEQ